MMGVLTPEFGTKTYYLAIFLLKTSLNEKNWTERGHTLLVPPWINQCISTSNDTSIVKSGEQKLNGKLISKSEDDEFLWPQHEDISSKRISIHFTKLETLFFRLFNDSIYSNTKFHYTN